MNGTHNIIGKDNDQMKTFVATRWIQHTIYYFPCKGLLSSGAQQELKRLEIQRSINCKYTCIY